MANCTRFVADNLPVLLLSCSWLPPLVATFSPSSDSSTCFIIHPSSSSPEAPAWPLLHLHLRLFLPPFIYFWVITFPTLSPQPPSPVAPAAVTALAAGLPTYCLNLFSCCRCMFADSRILRPDSTESHHIKSPFAFYSADLHLYFFAEKLHFLNHLQRHSVTQKIRYEPFPNSFVVTLS